MVLSRVLFVPQHEDKSDDLPLIIDLLLDENSRANSMFPTFGMYGGFSSTSPKSTVIPFVLYKDGKMDFGDQNTYLNDKDRFDFCDIFNEKRKRIIEIGATVCVVSDEKEYSYRVAKISNIANVENIKE